MAMGIDAASVFGALNEALAKTLNQALDVGQGQTVLKILRMGMMLDSSEFDDGWTPTHPVRSPAAAERLAVLVDCVPSGTQQLFADTQLSVARVYGQFVGGESDDPAVARALSDAHHTHVQAARLSVSDGSSSWWPCLATPDRWYSTDASPLFRSLSITVEGGAGDSAAATNRVPEMRHGPPLKHLPNGPPGKQTSSHTNPAELHGQGAWLCAPDVSSLIAAAQEESADEDRSSPSDVASLRRPVVVRAGQHVPVSRRATIGGTQAPGRNHFADETAGIRISMSYLIVRLNRRWLDGTAFSLRPITMAGRAPFAVSNGQPVDNGGLMPLIPTGFVVARDLKVSAERWGLSDAGLLRGAAAGDHALALGPFSIGAPSPLDSSAISSGVTFDGTSIQVPGLQLLAWFCQVVPPCPMP